MSLLLSFVGTDFAVAVSDGRVMHKDPDGTATPIGEHLKKIHQVSDECVGSA